MGNLVAMKMVFRQHLLPQSQLGNGQTGIELATAQLARCKKRVRRGRKVPFYV